MAWHKSSGVVVDHKHGSGSSKKICTIFRHGRSSSPSPTLGILAFETAKTMTRLAALYKSLSDDEFFKLREGPIKSPGVAVLNSADETYLLGLACKEKLEDLNRAAAVVSRLGKKCVDQELSRFDSVYRNIIKQGIVNDANHGNRHHDFSSRNVVKIIEKMEKFTNSTSLLYSSMVALNELEMTEKKMQKLKQRNADKPNIDYFNDKISFQRKQVRHYRQISLWSQTFDASVRLMARTVRVVYVRICTIFGPFVPNLPRYTKNPRNLNKNNNKNKSNTNYNLHISKPKTLQKKVYPETNYNGVLIVNNEKQSKKQGSKSGPLMKTTMNIKPISSPRFHSSELSPNSRKTSSIYLQGINTLGKKGLLQSAPENTVGAAGLAIRYANVIIMSENYFYSTTEISEKAREYMFEMLPMSLKQTLRGKLKSHWCKDAEEREGQQGLAEGWKEALEEIIGWLSPLAHDTLRWQQERNLEQQTLDAKPSVLLLQTLHFSDLELTEAAIVDVLVGLSCIYRYENRRERTGLCRNWL